MDIERGIIALGGELHIDEEVFLIEEAGSKNENIWGINLYPDEEGENFIEFDSMINIKPNLGNRTRGVDNPLVKDKIRGIIKKILK